MAPKATRNPGDKTEGVKTTRVGRDKGELVGVNKCLMSIVGKPAGKNMLGLGKDAKMSDSTTPAGNQGKEPTLPSTSSKKLCIENNEPLIKPIQGTENVTEIEDNNRKTREKELGPPAGNKQPQTQQLDQFEQLEHESGEGTASTSGPATEREDLHKSLGSPKRWGKITGKDPQFVDWGKDNSDKFYSLTEESDLSSGDHSFGGSDYSEKSEAEQTLSSNKPTVGQLCRQRKSVKTRPCSQEVLENSTSTGGRTLKWDYSGIGLADSPCISNQGSVNGKKERDTGAPACNSSAMGTEAGMLQSIYSSIKELQTETRIKIRRARITTKRLQGTAVSAPPAGLRLILGTAQAHRTPPAHSSCQSGHRGRWPRASVLLTAASPLRSKPAGSCPSAVGRRNSSRLAPPGRCAEAAPSARNPPLGPGQCRFFNLRGSTHGARPQVPPGPLPHLWSRAAVLGGVVGPALARPGVSSAEGAQPRPAFYSQACFL
ncbi:hypothetical protein NDU88_003866 [Pleurodeles waltl]|uniref:Uncharacterized protein n=1 Tax=Pleurodeles waltl TaxID=8319 RepID=A0AAV7NKJ8_PLEWA|nr:hypothetical protein NDU88_003866 [Pleurodeles waltl]